jgi:hypothetical protein
MSPDEWQARKDLVTALRPAFARLLPTCSHLLRRCTQVRRCDHGRRRRHTLFTVSSKDQRQGSIRSLRRVIGPVSGVVLVLMLSGGVNARQLRIESPETRAIYQRDDRMILMLKLNTDAGRQVLIYG